MNPVNPVNAMAPAASAQASLWQEAWAILAQAWRPPATTALCLALRQHLAPDLHSLAQELGLDLATAPLAALLAGPDDETLLVDYARLFLVPPCAAHLDLGNGLNGEQMGAYAQAMARTLAELGLEIPADRHEHPDHLPIALEVAALLECDPARGALQPTHLDQTLQGVEALQNALRRALERQAEDSPWYLLATLTAALLSERLARLGALRPGAASTGVAQQRRADRDALSQRVRAAHRHEPVSQVMADHAQRSGVPPEALLEMIAALESRGLDASHLRGQLPGEGWRSLQPPQAKRAPRRNEGRNGRDESRSQGRAPGGAGQPRAGSFGKA